MSEQHIVWLCVAVALVGIGAIGAIVFFGMFLFKNRKSPLFFDHPLSLDAIHYLEKSGSRWNIPRFVSEAFSESLERRNEFWTAYGQLVVATLIIIVLTILLLTKTITAEAGLPILSAISGFAIAKGTASGRAGSSGPDNQG